MFLSHNNIYKFKGLKERSELRNTSYSYFINYKIDKTKNS